MSRFDKRGKPLSLGTNVPWYPLTPLWWKIPHFQQFYSFPSTEIHSQLTVEQETIQKWKVGVYKIKHTGRKERWTVPPSEAAEVSEKKVDAFNDADVGGRGGAICLGLV